ncbi:glycosyltransferase family 9 protein [Marinobacter metalliresistant]|uniref:Glycosyltransferase family 9 protein n=1 Tax=Marinobacter metalliresistant TaxID=2961995 RepID=A0ABZ2VZK7_9GAMM
MRSVCILRLSAIGDVTHVVPVVLSLQEQCPGVHITWIIGKMEAQLVGDLPGVEFIVFDKKSGWRGYRDLWEALRSRRFDALLHMQVAFRANLAAACVRASTRIGYDKARSKDLHGLFINRRIPQADRQHVRDCLASFLIPLGLKPAPAKWIIPVADADRKFSSSYLASGQQNLIISPCASHTLRNWSADRYARLADYAISEYGMNVILVGSPAPFETDFCQSIASQMHQPVTNICGKDTLKQLAAMMAAADLVVAPDTGPTHIASAMGTDVIGLYAASNPNRSGPYNSLTWCVDRYSEALSKYTGKSVESARWGAKAEFEGAMDLITVKDVCAKLDEWVAIRNGQPSDE